MEPALCLKSNGTMFIGRRKLALYIADTLNEKGGTLQFISRYYFQELKVPQNKKSAPKDSILDTARFLVGSVQGVTGIKNIFQFLNIQ